MSRQRTAVVTLGIMLGIFMASMEATVVATAMPTIVGQLGGLASYSWVFSGYMLTSTTTVPLFGKFSDLYDIRNLYDPFYIPASLKGNSVDVILFNLKRVETWDAVSEYLDKYAETYFQANKTVNYENGKILVSNSDVVYTYGTRLVDFEGIDQLDILIKGIKNAINKNQESRRSFQRGRDRTPARAP